MNTIRFCAFLLLSAAIGCTQFRHPEPAEEGFVTENEENMPGMDSTGKYGNGALLLTRFHSLEEFKSVVHIQYFGGPSDSTRTNQSKPYVQLTYHSGGHEVISILKSGISQADFSRARSGTLWDKTKFVLKCPFAFIYRKDLGRIENLGRRRPWLFGKGDVAFYDIAETTVSHIREEDRLGMPAEDLSEKGYLNTFNHVTAQAIMTSVFSQSVADFVADVHELYNMPELITGRFTEAQLSDFDNGPADNYVDMLNNEWGQELGQELQLKYAISRQTDWTPGLLANYLNDIQSYYSWAFQIGFKPFRPTDEIVWRFADKMNGLLGHPVISYEQ